jgi:carboxyl-terminal processing protease
MNKRWLLIGVILSSLALGGVFGQFGRSGVDAFLATPAGRAFIETYNALRSDYLTEVDDETIIRGAIRGMLEALDDPYTSYVTPRAAEIDRQDRTGTFSGIGATLSARNRRTNTMVEIINVYAGSPAERAGIQRGDIFVEVDGVNVEDYTTEEIVQVVRGPQGSTVELGMFRPSENEVIYFSVVRDTIEIISVEATVLPENVGYISITTFANQLVTEQLLEQIANLQEQGITSLILDLRNNGGGLLTQGIQVADVFLNQGDIVFQRSRGVTQRLASASPDSLDLPMVVLVNRNSASASEIVAGALQDNGRALVIGEETFGKGVGQSVSQLSDGGQLVLLNFEWLTPSRRSINQQGIVPDIVAVDELLPNIISLEGDGARPGQTIEIVVDGEVVGQAEVDDDGNFSFFQAVARPDRSPIQGQALVDLANDPALQVAFDTVLAVAAGELVTGR